MLPMSKYKNHRRVDQAYSRERHEFAATYQRMLKAIWVLETRSFCWNQDVEVYNQWQHNFRTKFNIRPLVENVE